VIDAALFISGKLKQNINRAAMFGNEALKIFILRGFGMQNKMVKARTVIPALTIFG
jgi:hypothetical protein